MGGAPNFSIPELNLRNRVLRTEEDARMYPLSTLFGLGDINKDTFIVFFFFLYQQL